MNSGNSNYQPLKLIGKGGFGNVILCRCINKSDNYVCIKQIEIKNSHASEMKLIRGEIYIISQLKHPRIIQFIEYYFYKNTVNIVMEYASGGTLRQLLDKRCQKLFTETEIRKLFCDILLGLEYLHIRGVVHRDLKPENVLIDHVGRPKIADFGISFIHIDILTETISALGTPLYIAPEVLRGRTSDFRSDIWALGCILYEICTFVNPFKHCRNIKQLNEILLFSKHEYVSAEQIQYNQSVKQICKGMLTMNPDKRISISEIISNPWITLNYYTLYFDYTSNFLSFNL